MSTRQRCRNFTPNQSRIAPVAVGVWIQMFVAGAFTHHVGAAATSLQGSFASPINSWNFRQSFTSGRSYARCKLSRKRTFSGCSRGRKESFTTVFEKEQAVGDGPAGDSKKTRGKLPGGISIEPPGFLKRIFSLPRNVRKTVSVNDVVVPVIGAREGWGRIRQGLMNRGIYPGVEYRIQEISVIPGSDEGDASALTSAREAPDGAFESGQLIFTMRPAYPLVKKLEREWPVRVPAREFPVLLEPFSYNAATAWGALSTSLTFLAVGFALSQAITFSVIPSRSMEPTLQVGDVVLVEKISRSLLVRRNDIIFFSPPPALRQVVTDAGGTLGGRDLFVKRVAALPGDYVTVNADGSVEVVEPPRRSAAIATQTAHGSADQPRQGQRQRLGAGQLQNSALPEAVLKRIRVTEEVELPRAQVFVLGDNPAASMDSRVWGDLDENKIVGHALLRVFPLRSFGLLL